MKRAEDMKAKALRKQKINNFCSVFSFKLLRKKNEKWKINEKNVHEKQKSY